MQSKDPRDYNIVLQYSIFETRDEAGLIKQKASPIFKTFWLVEKEGDFKRRYSTESAPDWVMFIYNKVMDD